MNIRGGVGVGVGGGVEACTIAQQTGLDIAGGDEFHYYKCPVCLE